MTRRPEHEARIVGNAQGLDGDAKKIPIQILFAVLIMVEPDRISAGTGRRQAELDLSDLGRLPAARTLFDKIIGL